jgi:ATP-dependent RNA helicase RhlE
LVDPEEAYLLAAIEKLLKREIPRVADTGYEKVSLEVTNSKPKPKAQPAPARKPNQAKPGQRPYGAKKPQGDGDGKRQGAGRRSRPAR